MNKRDLDEICEKLVEKLRELEGNSGCDYKRNCVISECISEVKIFFKEVQNER